MLHKHGCVILDSRGKILSCGYNFNSPNPKKGKETWSVHAEAAAAMKVKKEKLVGATFIVVRVNEKGELINSEPCEMKCKRMLRKLRAGKVYHS